MKSIIDIISTIDTGFPNINPTIIYNEGWMSRLLVNQSLKERTQLKGIDFGEIVHWTSEALIASPFTSAETFREGYTHADIALGDFEVDYVKRGEISIPNSANIFGIIEAKMGSNLSQGTTHFKNYNQASRNLACICSQTFGIDCKIFFVVVAPKIKLINHAIAKQIELDYMIQQILNRFGVYSDRFKSEHHMEQIIEKARTCYVLSISYEEWIEAIIDSEAKGFIMNFYDKAKKWNRIG